MMSGSYFMDEVLQLFTSDLAVAIAWLCTVGSTLYSLILKRENSRLKLTISNTTQTLDQSSENSLRSVTQNADKAVYTEKNVGDMNINM
jgi:hypothetical protein